jgi:hypothetical protein
MRRSVSVGLEGREQQEELLERLRVGFRSGSGRVGEPVGDLFAVEELAQPVDVAPHGCGSSC